MALRAFQSNPAIGGFGGEGGSSVLHCINQNRATKKATQNKEQSTSTGPDKATRQQQSSASSQLAGESCDAFAQIVKELVDNAVDACAREKNDDIGKENEHAASASSSLSKRVRVEIKPTQISLGDDNDDATTTMDCLRVKVSDNGCGMEDIDDCVSAFGSTKNRNVSSQQQQTSAKQTTKGKKSKSESKENNSGSNTNNKHAPSSYTSGRYGVGLTLCLLHAQRLVPNSVTLIVTSTKTSDHWTIRRYRADTEKDEIVCLKEERLPKIDKEECGTIVEVLVPGGQGAITAWPRLAEYFARFQLSIDLPCSIEVKAETLQPLPLYIRPPNEMERRIHGKRIKPLAVDVLMNSTLNNDVENDVRDDSSDNNDVGDWDDGFGGGNDDNEESQRVSKSIRERARLEEEKNRKVCLMQKAASLYKGRIDLRDANIAYSTQRIRHKSEAGKSNCDAGNSSVLEMSMVVFGPSDTIDGDDDRAHSGNDTSCNKTAKLQVVRMVNGIPVLDSSEALACGVMTKISGITSIWNSFGLDISDRSQLTSTIPSFGISDSAQVAPFLRTSTHSLYSSQSQDDALSISDDNDEFDMEEIHNTRKRKKERQARCILPAAQRLGDVLLVVQIRAKPSALPLPTLSKGRLPVNDKSINDALENAITDCLRSLQMKNPRLLLTAHHLKKIERDVKYAPLVAGAVASVLSRSRKQGLYQSTFNVASRWDEEVKNMGLSLAGNSIGQRIERVQTTLCADGGKAKSLALGQMIERRIRFVVSAEFESHQKAEEMEYKRQQRQEMAAERKKAKESMTAESEDGLNSDVFGGSDEDSVCNNDENSPVMNLGASTRGENEGDGLVDGFQSDGSSCSNDTFVEPIFRNEQENEVPDDDSWSSEFGECVDGAFFR